MRTLSLPLLMVLALASGTAWGQPTGHDELFVLSGSTMYYVGGCNNLVVTSGSGMGQITLNCPYLSTGTTIQPLPMPPPNGMVWDFTVTSHKLTFMGEACIGDVQIPGPNGGSSTILHCPPKATGRR